MNDDAYRDCTCPVVNRNGTHHDCDQHESSPFLQGSIMKNKKRFFLASRRLRWMVITLPVLAFTTAGLVYAVQGFVGVSEAFLSTGYYGSIDWRKPGFHGNTPDDVDTTDISPVPCHSHNDGQRKIPLYDALAWGCTSIEADVWQHDGELLVGHSKRSLDKTRKFRSMYIDPLVELLDRRNGNPSTSADQSSNEARFGIFDTDPSQTLVLMVDFKQSTIFDQVSDHLEPLRSKGYLSHWTGEEFVSGPITVVASGEAPFDRIASSSHRQRDIFYDAPLHALTDSYNTSNSYFASTNFRAEIGSLWSGHLTPIQIAMIRDQIATAHGAGLKARYWGTPSWPVSLRNYVWHVLIEEGEDILNVDDLKGIAMTW